MQRWLRAEHLVAPLALVTLVACEAASEAPPLPADEVAEADAAAAPTPKAPDAPEVEAAPAPPGEGSSATRPAVHATDCPDGMVRVEGGALHGLKSPVPTTVASFCLDRDEVSVAAFRASGATVPTRTDWGDPAEDGGVSRFCNGNLPDRDAHPVNCVTRPEAVAFCAARGARLPSSEEWEWAARGADVRATPWGAPVATDQICWGKPQSKLGTCAPDAFPADVTAAGVRNLGGNLSEWTTPPRGLAPDVLYAHGASWYAIDDGYAAAALGGFETPARRAELIGFRCAADLPRP